MRLATIVIPYDSARRGERMGAGPEHLLDRGLATRLSGAGHEVTVEVIEAPRDGWLAEIGTAFALARSASHAVHRAIQANAFPLILSGNCGPAALGAAGGLDRPGVFWFDAHGDFNTPDSTPGGFLDGMSLASLAGRCWGSLASSIPGFTP